MERDNKHKHSTAKA